MQSSRIHWFETDDNQYYAVIVNRSRLISPLKIRDFLRAKGIFQQNLYSAIKDLDSGIRIKVILDFNIATPKGVEEIYEMLPPKIAEKIESLEVVGQYHVSESINETGEIENHDFLSRRLRDMMKNLSELAPLDSTGRKLLMLKSRRNLMERDLFAVIENDPALSAQLMNWACSAFYGNSSPAKSVRDAIKRILGVEQSLIMSIGLSIQKSFKIDKSLKKYLDHYIRRSIYVASVAQYVSEETSVKHDRETIYLSGMLHNLGELILMQLSPGLYRHIVAYLQVNPGHNSEYVQHHILKMSYADIGVILGEQWELPSSILEVMSHGQVDSITDLASGDDKIIAFSQEWLAKNSLIDIRSECNFQGVDHQLGMSDERVGSIEKRFFSKLEYSNALIASISS